MNAYIVKIRNIVFRTLLLFCVCPVVLNAQDNANRNLRVIFIDHEPSTPSSTIIAHIRKLRAQALENDHALIFYMPNDQNPFVSLVNIPDPQGERDSQEAFDRICEALNLPSHNKEPWFDRKTFANLVLKDFPILDDKANLTFASVRMEFYLTSEFWKLGYNESIIAPLFFSMNVPELLKKEFNFDVYINPEDAPVYPAGQPFGKKNLGGINKYVSLFEYDF